jgi:hypothetical protein
MISANYIGNTMSNYSPSRLLLFTGCKCFKGSIGEREINFNEIGTPNEETNTKKAMTWTFLGMKIRRQ